VLRQGHPLAVSGVSTDGNGNRKHSRGRQPPPPPDDDVVHRQAGPSRSAARSRLQIHAGSPAVVTALHRSRNNRRYRNKFAEKPLNQRTTENLLRT